MSEGLLWGPVVAPVTAAELHARHGPPFFHVKQARLFCRGKVGQLKGFQEGKLAVLKILQLPDKGAHLRGAIAAAE